MFDGLVLLEWINEKIKYLENDYDKIKNEVGWYYTHMGMEICGKIKILKELKEKLLEWDIK